MGYNYDQIYSYEKILEEVKELLLPTIIDRINPDDVSKTHLRKEDLAEIIYCEIMALGFNSKDINAAVNELMPTRNPFIYKGPDETDAASMAMHLVIISNEYFHQLEAFEMFHQMTKELRPRDEVIRKLKMRILML